MNGPDFILQALGTGVTQRIEDLAHGDARLAKALIAGTVASIIAGFDDEEWEKIMAASKMPCDNPDCDCHIYGEQTFIGLNAGREHHKLVVAKWEKTGSR